MEIRYVDYAIANNFGNYIEINRNLKQYPKLYNSILKHELEHKPGGFSFFDLIHDLKPSEYTKELFSFMFNNPKSFLQFLPIYWTRKKGFVYDVNLCIVYMFFLLIISSTIFLSLKFL